MPAPRPRAKQEVPGLLSDAPSKWEQTKQVLWDSNLNAPIRGFYNLMNTPDYVLSGGGTPDEMEAAAGSSFDVAGGVTAGSGFAPKPSNAVNMGIRAYHGSPHSFDKFSTDKIGTGEGAQVYGHGLYFAENEGVAGGYRKNLSYKHLKDKFLNELPQDADFADVEDLMSKGYFSPEETRFLTELRNNDWLGFDYPSQAISAATRGKLDNYDPTPELQDASSKLGHQYEVDINADPEHFIDYDKPMGDQPHVTNKLGGWDANVAHWERNKIGPDPRTLTGGQFLARITKDPAKTSTALKERGIPGVKYLDAGSRRAGDGTRNYVVFDDQLVNILKKYGIAGLLGSSAAYGATNQSSEDY